MSEGYAFDNAWRRGAQRLSSLELTYDRFTLPLLDALPIDKHASCLEVGCGAGSVARHLADRLGHEGRVVAMDIDVRHFVDPPANVDLQQQNIHDAELEPGSFDLVHTRMVLNHLAQPESVLRKLVTSLRIGGIVFVEEGDVFPNEALDEGLHTRVLTHLYNGMVHSGSDIRLGRRLTGMLDGIGLVDVLEARCVVPQIEGGSAQTEFMLRSVEQARGRMTLPTLTDKDIHTWSTLLGQRHRWFTGLGLYQIVARRTR